MQGGGEDTEMRESCEVTSVEEGHDVDGRHAPQSAETAGILKQLKDETSADPPYGNECSTSEDTLNSHRG